MVHVTTTFIFFRNVQTYFVSSLYSSYFAINKYTNSQTQSNTSFSMAQYNQKTVGNIYDFFTIKLHSILPFYNNFAQFIFLQFALCSAISEN